MLTCQVMLTTQSSKAKHKESSLISHCSRQC